MTDTIGEITELLDQLKAPERERREEALARLADAGPAGFAAVREGLSHPHWRVRRNCCRFLDHHFDPKATDALIHCLTDRNRKVRQQALHALSCDACKPGEGPEGRDIIGYMIERLRHDPSVRVRRFASISLVQFKAEHRVGEALRRALSDPDPIVQRNAGWGLGG
jgi:HEAT repeat protein